MDIILGFAILMGFVWFLSRTVSDWFLRAFEEGPTGTTERSRSSNVEVIYPSRVIYQTRRWAEPRRV
jgi:hypothetical protein